MAIRHGQAQGVSSHGGSTAIRCSLSGVNCQCRLISHQRPSRVLLLQDAHGLVVCWLWREPEFRRGYGHRTGGSMPVPLLRRTCTSVSPPERDPNATYRGWAQCNLENEMRWKRRRTCQDHRKYPFGLDSADRG